MKVLTNEQLEQIMKECRLPSDFKMASTQGNLENPTKKRGRKPSQLTTTLVEHFTATTDAFRVDITGEDPGKIQLLRNAATSASKALGYKLSSITMDYDNGDGNTGKVMVVTKSSK